MIARALQKYLKISSKKLIPIASIVSRKKVEDAIYILLNVNKKGAAILKKVVESALNNARRIPQKDFAEEDLYISKITVDQGPTLKRFRAMSMGRAGKIRKRTSHVLVELDALKRTSPKEKAAGRKRIVKKKFIKAGK